MNYNWIWVNDDNHENFLWEKYWYAGGNSRYYTFQIALNLLLQRTLEGERPVILETGCQRQKDDVGAGMSTSIFAEFVSRLGRGKVISVDNNMYHLHVCGECIEEWKDRVELVCSDSISYLKDYKGPLDLLYLDSLDYPVGGDEGNVQMQQAAQNHCLAEFQAIESQVTDRTIVLLDDATLAGGGKPRKLNEYLASHGFICLLALQSVLWVRSL